MNNKNVYKEMFEASEESREAAERIAEAKEGLWIDAYKALLNVKPKHHRRPPDLNAEKARKMAADATLSELKLEKQKGDLASTYCNMLYDCFVRAFSPFKLRLIELNLNKEQTRQLQKMVETALADMRMFIEKELQPPEEEDETEDTEE